MLRFNNIRFVDFPSAAFYAQMQQVSIHPPVA
jgi:hypothetical protein